MSERTLLKKVNDLKVLEVQKKTIEKRMELLQEDIRRELQAKGQEETEVDGWMVRSKAIISNKSSARAFAASHPELYQKCMGQSQTIRFTVKQVYRAEKTKYPAEGRNGNYVEPPSGPHTGKGDYD